jgi:hypothetical protein
VDRGPRESRTDKSGEVVAAGRARKPGDASRATDNLASARILTSAITGLEKENAPAADPASRGLLPCGCQGGAPGCASCRAAALAPTLRRKPSSGARRGGIEAAFLGAPGTGGPLPSGERAFFEPRFGVDLSGVRVHADPAAASASHALGARAFGIGPELAFAAGEFQPATTEGRRLLAHELAHFALGHAGLRRKRDASADPDREADEPLPPETDEDEEAFATAKRPFAWDLDPQSPEYIWVSADASRNEIALNVLGDGLRTDAFDFVSPGENVVEQGDTGFAADATRRAIRLRNPDSAPDALRAKVRAVLDPLVDQAVRDTVARIVGGSGPLAPIVLRWSRYADFHDAAGVSYFERYLAGLEAHTIVTTRGIGSWRWGRTERNALQDMLEELDGIALEIVQKAVTLRGGRDVGYTRRDAGPQFTPGTVIGRWISGHDEALVPVFVGQVLVTADTRTEAEVRTRSSSYLGPRAVIAGSDGRFYGYALTYSTVSGGGAVPGIEHGSYAWYYPDVLFIGPGDFDAQGIEMGPDTAYVLDLVGDALKRTTPQNARPLYGLDYGALQVASTQDRLEIFRAVLDAGAMGDADAVAVLTRTVLTMPATQFSGFERQLDKSGLLKRLVGTRENANRSALAQLGQAFTLQAMATAQIGPDAFGDPTVLQLGDMGVSTAYYQAEAGSMKSRVVAPDPWDPLPVAPPTAKGPGPLREPALPGEQPGEMDRTTISFTYGGFPNAQADSSRWNRRSSSTTRAFLPMELLAIEQHYKGKSSQRVVSALEAALIQGDPQKEASGKDFSDFIDTLMLFSAMKGLTALGGMAARAAATGSLRAGMALLAEQLATQAGKTAVRGVVDYALLSAGHYAAEHQEELEKTPQGRLFMSLTTAAIAFVAVRDVQHLFESGLPGRLLVAGKEAMGVASAAARRGIAATMREFRAYQIARDAMRLEAPAMELAGGAGQVTLGPLQKAERFGQLFRVARGQAAKELLIESVGAGSQAGKRAEAVLGRLESAAGGAKGAVSDAEKASARAYADVAHAAQGMPATEVEKFLDAVEATLNTGKRQAADMAPALRAAVKAKDPIAALGDLQALAGSKLSREAFTVMCAKAGRVVKGRPGIDLAWWRTIELPPTQMEALAKDANTPWNLFMEAARNPADTALQLRAMARLRGASAEMIAAESADQLVPGWRIEQSQVEMGESIIDFRMKSTARTGTTRALEVKGWTRETWSKNLDLWERFKDVPLKQLTDEQRAGVRAVEHMIGQLEDAAAVKRAADPVLAVTKNMKVEDVDRLEAILRDRLNRPVELIQLDEKAIVARGRELREGLGIPGPQKAADAPVE